MQYFSFSTVLCIYLFATTNTALANDETDYSKLGQDGYALWNCATIASFFDKSGEGEGLFLQGYEALASYARVMNSDDVSVEYGKGVPLIVLANLSHGPSHDFTLGVIWQKMLTQAEIELAPKNDYSNIKAYKKARNLNARSKFKTLKCEVQL